MVRLLVAAVVAALTALSAFADQAASFFDDTAVREIRIYFDDANWYNTLQRSHASDAADPYFPARFQYGSTVLNKVGVRMKGNSSFQRNGIKKPFKIDFNEYDDNITFLGLKKLNLNNGDLQPDFLREKLLHDFAGKYVAALRSVHVRLYINDAFYGLYLAVEQPDKVMMQSRFGDDEDGNLYEAEEQMGGTSRPTLAYLGANQSAYENVYLLKTNETKNDFSGLIEFLNVLNNTTTAELPTKLEPLCDVENWLYGMAVNNLIVNLDSYLGVAAEYYLYDRTRDGKFIHIQWDHNESFGITGDGTPRLANPFTTDPFYLPTTTGQGGGAAANARPLLTKLWAVDDYRRLYLRILARFLREGFDATTMAARVKQLADLIRPHVYEDPNKAYTNAQFETALNNQVAGGNLTIYGLNQFVRERYAYLRPLLNTYAQPSDVRLNEVVSVNNGAVKDAAGDADPWVELHNPGPGPVTLTGFYLTDDPSLPTKWAVPTRTLADGEFLVIWLDGEPAEGDTHASFRPQSAGGRLFLYSTAAGAQTALDSVTYPVLTSGQSYVRLGDYASRWALTHQPTSGAANLVVAATIPVSKGTGQLLINEVMADNDSAFGDPDEVGSFEDWFEVYNPGTTAVDMSGMYITDNLSNPTKWKVAAGTTIPAKGYLVFIADGETAQGARHTSWSLSADGESVGIYQTDGSTLIDSVTFHAQQTDVAYGRTTDGAATWSLFRPATPGAANASAYANWIVNGASFQVAPVAKAAIASIFAQTLAASTEVAGATLPTTLGGVTVTVTDSVSAARTAPLYFVSSGQVNFFVPRDAASGRATVAIRRPDGSTITGAMLVDTLWPGVFSANSSGEGVGLIGAVRVDSAGVQTPLPAYSYDAAQQKMIATPVSLGVESDKVYLVLYGTGIRGVAKLADATITVGGQAVPVTYAGAQPQYEGLDQVNVGPLPRALLGKGEVPVLLTVGGKRANTVTVSIQ